MDSNVIDMQAYSLMLEELLARLRQEIDNQSHLEAVHPADDLDRYLLHINTYYYQSFQEQYLPQYRQRWQEEVKELLLLSQQQQVLETNIMSTLKRYTRLHNLLKTLLANIKTFFHLNEQEAALVEQETLRQGTELLLAITDLQNQLQSLQAYLAAVSPYVQDAELMRYLNEYPGYAEVFNLEAAHPQGLTECPHQLNQAISEVTYLIGLLHSPIMADRVGGERVAEDMQIRIKQLQNTDEGRDPLSIWITRKFTRELSLYLSALSAQPGAPETRELIVDRLQGWQKVLKLLAAHRASGSFYRGSLSFLCHASAEGMQESRRDVEFSIQQLNPVITSLQQTPEASYQVLVQVREWLAFWAPFLRSMSTEEEVQRIPHLNALLHQARVSIALLSNQLSMIETARRRAAYNQDQVERMRALAESQLVFLGQLKADLDRLLAPRNIARTWKDMGVRLLKLPLQKGQVFPTEYIHLLEQARWESRNDVSLPDFTILHEEGDLFIIHVLNEEQIEFPFMIMTRQPSAQEF